MTKERANQIIREAWVRDLRRQDDIPENIADVYKGWLQSIIQAANAQLMQQQAQPEQQQQQQDSRGNK